MTRVQITWTRTCEYVATVDTAELRELVSALPGTERDTALRALDGLEARDQGTDWVPQYHGNTLAHVINSTETGQEYLGALADDNPDYLGGTGVPEMTGLWNAT